MCRVELSDRIAMRDLRCRLGVDSVVDVIRRGSLRWFGFARHADPNDFVRICENLTRMLCIQEE
jgi:hypothetical protein